MNKKFLSVVLFGALMAGSSVTFTGCIDNDEPAGIENLRGAKAELIKAKSAVELAKADYKAMEVKWLETQVKAKEIENQMAELKLQKQQAKTEAEIAKINAQLEIAKVNWEKDMLAAKEQLAWAQKSYEDALKAIELAESVLSDGEREVLQSAKSFLTDATKDMNKKYQAMIDAQEDLSDAYLDFDEEAAKTRINQDIALKNIEKAAAERNIKRLENILAKDFGTADWEKEVQELEDSIEVINNEIRGKQLEVKTIQNSDEYKAAHTAWGEADNAYKAAKVPADFSYEIPAAIAMNFNSTPNAPADHIVVEGDKKFFKLTKEESATGVLDNIITPLVNIVDKDLEKFTAEWEANKENAVKDAEEALASAKEDHTKAVKIWKEKLAKYEEIKEYDIATDQKAAIEVINKYYDVASTNLTGPNDTETNRAKQATARKEIADALVKYYKAVDSKTGLTTNEFELTIQIGSTNEKVKKSFVEWLDDAYGGIYLQEILMNNWRSWGSKEQFIGATVTNEVQPGFIKELTTKKDFEEKLGTASDKAFGESEYYFATEKWLTVEPTAADIAQAYAKAASKNATAFKVIDAEKALADAKLKPEQKTAYEAFKKALTDEKAVIEKHVEGLKTAVDEAKAAFEEQAESIKAIETEIGALESSRTSISNIKNYLVSLIKNALGGGQYETEELYKEAVSKQLEQAKKDMADIEQAINHLEKQLAQIEEGTYTDQMYIEYKKVLLDEATKAYEAAKVVYEDAQARLQAVIEKLTKASAE